VLQKNYFSSCFIGYSNSGNNGTGSAKNTGNTTGAQRCQALKLHYKGVLQ
jgi:hypothetical protein